VTRNSEAFGRKVKQACFFISVGHFILLLLVMRSREAFWRKVRQANFFFGLKYDTLIAYHEFTLFRAFSFLTNQTCSNSLVCLFYVH
jgi:hypothetical protein